MKKGIIGKKIGMTQVFDEMGNVIPVTVIQAGPCTVVQKKTVENDGYASLQLGYQDVAESKVTKPMKGHFNKAGVTYKRFSKSSVSRMQTIIMLVMLSPQILSKSEAA